MITLILAYNQSNECVPSRVADQSRLGRIHEAAKVEDSPTMMDSYLGDRTCPNRRSDGKKDGGRTPVDLDRRT